MTQRHPLVLSLLGLALVVPLACGEHDETPTATPGDAASTPSAAANTSEGQGGAGLTTSVRALASAGPKVERMKLRFDADGNLVKQSVYHGDASSIPEAVRALAESTYPGSKATSYETEHYADQGDVFEVELELEDGQRCEVAANAAGDLLYTECRIDASELPAAVKTTIDATVAGATLTEVERKTVGNTQQYSVELRVEADGREHYLKLDAGGKLLHRYVMVPAVVELPSP